MGNCCPCFNSKPEEGEELSFTLTLSGLFLIIYFIIADFVESSTKAERAPLLQQGGDIDSITAHSVGVGGTTSKDVSRASHYQNVIDTAQRCVYCGLSSNFSVTYI